MLTAHTVGNKYKEVKNLTVVEIAKLVTEKEREMAHQSNRRTEYKILK